jgi:aromatic-L-amino-acid decarboxylase
MRLQGSASEACLTAAVTAREKALRVLEQQTTSQQNGGLATISQATRSEWTSKLVMYGSTQTHRYANYCTSLPPLTQANSLGAKAALILGLIWRPLPVGPDQLSLDGQTLETALQQDIKDGLLPFFVIGTVGTTSSGAIDHIDQLGQVCPFSLSFR